MSTLALLAPRRALRNTFLPFALPSIGEEEIEEVVDSLRSGWITTGPKVKRFEAQFAEYIGVRHAIAVSSCTAALHLALTAIGVGPGDEVIVPTLTFCATANVVVHLGATPVIVDVDETMQISLPEVRRSITPRTKAIVPVHFAGQACDLAELLALAREHDISLIEDAAHAAGSEYRGARIGTHGRAVAFSFYATKNLTTGEGGMITTNDDELAARMRLLSLHGMTRDAWNRYSQTGSWYYEVAEAGYKNNMTDIQASLGIHQLRRLDGFCADRRRMAAEYDEAFSAFPEIVTPSRLPNRNHVYHLYPIQLVAGRLSINRDQFIGQLQERRIGTSVHFIPLHRHPIFQRLRGCRPEQYPVSESLYQGMLSLPLYPKMSSADVADVIDAVTDVIENNRAGA
jgi:dTDP-4-amino-4,6-dideoxygalactose transaminase